MNDPKSFINKINDMPAMPNIIVKALSVIKSETSGMNDLAKIMSYDPALTTQVLKIVNSAYYGFPQQITAMNKALPLLGMAQVKNIIVAVAMKSMITSQGGKELWKHSIRAAVGCEMMATKLNLMDPGDAFVVGFLHDIGKMILSLQNSQLYLKVKELTMKGVNVIEAENLLVGANHAEMGALLAKKWGLPVMLTNCIKYHHTPRAASMVGNIVYMVYAIDRLVQEQMPNPAFEPAIWKNSPIEIADPASLREAILLKSDGLLQEL